MAFFFFLRRFFSVVYLMRHPAVPVYLKALPVLAFLYLIAPRDLIPDFRPFVGQVDDLVVIGLCLGIFTSKGWQHILRERQGKDDAIAVDFEVLDRVGEDAPRQAPEEESQAAADEEPSGQTRSEDGDAHDDGAERPDGPPSADLRTR